MPPQLREYGTKIKISICKSIIFSAFPLKSKCLLQTLECGSEFSSLPIIACFIIESNCQILGIAAREGLCLLQKHKTKIKLVLLQEYHGDQVAKFAHLNRNSFIFFTVAAKIVLIELQDFLIFVQSFSILSLPLQLLPLHLKGLHPLS